LEKQNLLLWCIRGGKEMRVVHYINQFFGQVGAENEANFPLEVRKGPVGPGMLLNNLLGEEAEVVATIICGDNYFAEHTDELTEDIVRILNESHAEVLVAGPAFTAGRYGLACGNVCKIAHQRVGIPAVSGMYKENPGLEMFKKYAYIFPTANNARGMKEAVEKMADFVKKLARKETIGSPEAEGYFQRGVRVPVFKEDIGAKRAVDMLIKKINGEKYETEMIMPNFTKFKPSPAIKDIKNATICIMTSGGIAPKGNPDGLEACFCTKYKFYDFDVYGGTKIPDSEVAHGGYDPTHANIDGNRVLPVDVLAELEAEGEIGRLYPLAGVTVGNAMAADQAATFGDAMAKELLAAGVDGVILTST
jgi:betaine reductase